MDAAKGAQDRLITIKEAAGLTGLSPKAIRHYEALGLCAPAARSPAGYRLYSPQDIQCLRQIRYLRSLKFSLREVAQLQNASPEQLHEAMRCQLDHVEMELAEFRNARMLLNVALASDDGHQLPAKDALAVISIDLQNDILPGGALPCKRILTILPRLRQLFQEARALGVPVIYLCDTHREGDLELLLWNDHMMEGSYGAQIIDEVAPEPCDYVVCKTRFNGFISTGLQSLLDSLNVQTLLFTGWRTDVCVAQTAIEAFYRGFHVAIAADGTDSTSQREHEYGMSLMQINYGFEVYPCAEALKALLRDRET